MLDSNAEKLIAILHENGFLAYAVGGCVRDGVMGRKTDDYDITTSALPQQVKQALSDYKTIDTGLKHGTVTAVADGRPYEITTFRKEDSYSDSRHPDSVRFVSDLKTDLSRRDFTMNALAYNTKEGIIDPFSGIEDIYNKIIRTVGNPVERFSEDALRILRALRFSSVLGFDMEPQTESAVNALAHTVKMVSPERIYTELRKLLCGEFAHKVLSKYKTALEKILDIEIKVDMEKFQSLPNDFPMRFAYLCGERVDEALAFLRADNKTKRLCNLLRGSCTIPVHTLEIKRFVCKYGRENAEYISNYRRTLYGEDASREVIGIVNSKDCLSIGELAIKGKDLLALGIPPRHVGTALSLALEMVIDERVVNNKEALVSKMTEMDFQ